MPSFVNQIYTFKCTTHKKLPTLLYINRAPSIIEKQ